MEAIPEEEEQVLFEGETLLGRRSIGRGAAEEGQDASMIYLAQLQSVCAVSADGGDALARAITTPEEARGVMKAFDNEELIEILMDKEQRKKFLQIIQRIFHPDEVEMQKVQHPVVAPERTRSCIKKERSRAKIKHQIQLMVNSQSESGRHATESGAESSKNQSSKTAEPAAAAAAEPDPGDLIAQEERMVCRAMACIDIAERACGVPEWEFEQARQRLLAQTSPYARGAAEAQMLVMQVAQRFSHTLLHQIIKNADCALRDLVVNRCRQVVDDPKDRDAFVDVAEDVYDIDCFSRSAYDKVVRAQLLLAYHKANSGIRMNQDGCT